jgi:hypothetical protein
MKSSKKRAIIIGALFLIALIPNIIANEIQSAILDVEHYLQNVYQNRHLLILSNFLNIICAIAMIFIPIVLYSSVNIKHWPFAVGYIIFRSLEGILFLFIAIKSFSYIGLSSDALDSNQIANSLNYFIGNNIKSEIHWATIVYLIIFCSGATLFYSLLYRSKLVPKFLSIWGLLGVLVLGIGTVLAMFNIGVFKSLPQLQGMAYFAPPIAINEFVLSFWLIVRGFNKTINE